MISFGAKKSKIQKFLNIEILLAIFYIYKSKLAKRNPSIASLKNHLKFYRGEMSNRSKAYRTMLNQALNELGPEYSQTFI